MVYSRFSSESVTEGHPDKVCDLISDSILDEYLKQDPSARVAVEAMASGNDVYVVGEVSANENVEVYVEPTVREVLRKVGYSHKWGYDPDRVNVVVNLREQSPEIHRAVDHQSQDKNYYDDLGAGDQGMMFGYANAQGGDSRLHPAHYLAHCMTHGLSQLRKSSGESIIGPDGKAMVTVKTDGIGRVKRVSNVLVSTQHKAGAESEVQHLMTSEMIPSILEREATKIGIDIEGCTFTVNPSGSFVVGGPLADAGLTGRKIIVDTYGGAAPHGGGCFSGKDASKVDRSGAYMARYVANQLISHYGVNEAVVQVSYAIGQSHPVAVSVRLPGFEQFELDATRWVNLKFDFRPQAIIDEFDLTSPQFARSTNYGHFGGVEFRSSWDELEEG